MTPLSHGGDSRGGLQAGSSTLLGGVFLTLLEMFRLGQVVIGLAWSHEPVMPIHTFPG